MGDDSDAQLEQRVEQVEQQLSKMLPGRRGVLKGLGAAALGGAAVGGATGGAAGQSAAGQIGTSSSPVDVEAANINAGSVNTDKASITKWRQPSTFTIWQESGTVYAMDPNGNIAFSGSDAATVINDAIADIPNHSEMGGIIHLKPDIYDITKQIVVPGTGAFDAQYFPVRIQSENVGAELRMADGANLKPMVLWKTPENALSGHSHGLYHIKLHGNKANNSDGIGISAEGPQGLRECELFHCWTFAFAGYGEELASGSNPIQNTRVYGHLSERHAQVNGNAAMKVDGKLTDIFVKQNAGDGLEVDDPETQGTNVNTVANDGTGLVIGTGVIGSFWSQGDNTGVAFIGADGQVVGRIGGSANYGVDWRNSGNGNRFWGIIDLSSNITRGTAGENDLINGRGITKDVSGSRSPGTTYTNDTDEPIHVHIVASNNTNSMSIALDVATRRVDQYSNGNSADPHYGSVQGVVAPGETYTFYDFSSSSVTIQEWRE